MNLIRWTGEHILVDKQEVSILAGADAAALILDEHLLGHINGKSSKGLFAGQQLFRLPRLPFFGVIETRDCNLHDAEGVVRTAGRCREV